jgi:hypothetical protein
MYAAAIPPGRLAGTESVIPRGTTPLSARAGLARADGNSVSPTKARLPWYFATWLAGVVLPSLDSRVRLDLVPLAG